MDSKKWHGLATEAGGLVDLLETGGLTLLEAGGPAGVSPGTP